NADRGQLQALHHENPAERGRGVQDEADVEHDRPQRLLAPAGELEEVIAQHTDHAECDRDEHRDRRWSHRRLSASAYPLPGPLGERPITKRNRLPLPLRSLRSADSGPPARDQPVDRYPNRPPPSEEKNHVDDDQKHLTRASRRRWPPKLPADPLKEQQQRIGPFEQPDDLKPRDVARPRMRDRAECQSEEQTDERHAPENAAQEQASAKRQAAASDHSAQWDGASGSVAMYVRLFV